MNKVLKNAATIIIMTLFIILSLEVAVRISGYSEKDLYDNIYTRYEGCEEIPFILKSNLINASGRNRIPISTDDKGFRIAIPGEVEGPKKDNEFRIAIIGDSITFGEGVKAEDTFCMVVERILNKVQNIKTVKVFNFGVSSYSVKEMYATLKYRVRIVDPDMVLICAITQDFLLDKCSQLTKYGYLANPKWGDPYKIDSLLFLFLRRMHLTYPIRDIVYVVFYKSKQKIEKTPPSYRYIRDAKDLTEKTGVDFVFVLLPIWGDDESNFAWIIKELNHNGIDYCDTSYLGTKYNKKQWCSSRYDFLHPSGLVHEAIGRKIAKYIVKYVVINK